ncbi:MAG TPA: sugar nucleotide-binding protein [Phycisphaerae bacterium]|nr:sugar nucleotide-binding protein [Phycisphaerae bacterium]
MICWITQNLGTAAYAAVSGAAGFRVLDVRDLVDRSGNRPADVRAKIDEGLAWLRAGEKVVVCCDLGMSRSNAVAAGILSLREGIPADTAVRRVLEATGEASIQIGVLSALRRALECGPDTAVAVSEESRRILLTGPADFTDSALLDELRKEHEVVPLNIGEVDLVRNPVALDLLTKEKGLDTVLHLASPAAPNTGEAMGTALSVLKHVLDVCVENDLFLIHLSSWEVFSGYRSKELWLDESVAPRPGGTYGRTHVLCETLISLYQQQQDIGCTILRPSVVYGPEGPRPRFLWNFLEKARLGQEIVTHRYANGLPVLDLLHVDDLRRAILESVARRVSGVIHLGTGVGTSTVDLAQLMVELLGSPSTIRQVEIERTVGNILVDTRRAAAILQWHPTVTLSQGLLTVLNVKKGTGYV